ncbi:MAG: protease family protein [Chthoniobacter sp.]|jgi:membrane protease YdiL (CAAX protease family)|nr:protease family protein [Chthoniobacter sp.]
MGVMIGAQSMVAVVFVVMAAVQHQAKRGAPLPVEELKRALAADPLLLSLSVLVSIPAVWLALWAIISFRKGPRFRDYLALRGFRPTHFLLWLGALVGVVSAGDWFVQAMGDTSGSTFMLNLLDAGRHLPLLVVALVVGAPVLEEVLFRGFMYRGMAASWRGAAILVPNVFWVVLHVQYAWPTLTVLFFMGLVFGLARQFSGSTLLPLTLHVVSNAISIFVALEMAGQTPP